MSLEYKISDLESVEENLRGMYRESDDGYVLDVTGIPAPKGDGEGLKKALRSERELRDKYERDAREKASALEKLNKELEEARNKGEFTQQDFQKKVDEMVKEVVERDFSPKLAEKERMLQESTTALKEKILRSEVVSAINAEGGIVEKLAPHILSQVGIELTEDGSVITFVRDEKGEPKRGSYDPETGQADYFTVRDLVKQYKENELWSNDFRNPASGVGVSPGMTKTRSSGKRDFHGEYELARKENRTVDMMRIKREAHAKGVTVAH